MKYCISVFNNDGFGFKEVSKPHKRIEAMFLRKRGYSVRSIAAKLGVSKSSVSIWVRNVPLTPDQAKLLYIKQYDRKGVQDNKR